MAAQSTECCAKLEAEEALAAVRAVMATTADEDEGRQAAEVLHAALEALLNAHPTSAEQDEELLRDGGGWAKTAKRR